MLSKTLFTILVEWLSKKQKKCLWVVVAHAFNPALGRQRQEDFCELKASLPGLQSEFQDRLQRYIEKPCVEKTKQNKTKQKSLCSWVLGHFDLWNVG